jgi:hypothetical protein
MENILKKGIERLEDVRFWLAVLRRFDSFTERQKEKLDIAYKEVNEVYDGFEQEKILDKLE